MNRDAITWFEIPAQNLDRAQTFCEQLLGAKLRRESMGGPLMAVFPAEECGVTGMGFFAHIVDCEGNRVGLHALA